MTCHVCGEPSCSCSDVFDLLALRETRQPWYYRAERGIHGVVTRLLPPQPEGQTIVNPPFSTPSRKRHALSIPVIAVFIMISSAQYFLFPELRFSPLILAYKFINAFVPSVFAIVVMIPSTLLLFRLTGYGAARNTSRYLHSKFLAKAAMNEEQLFREGAENWNWCQRVQSCLVFGCVHQLNLFYPFLTILPLSLAGGYFMWVYLHRYKQSNSRKEALVTAAWAHWAYNRIALCVLIVIVVASVVAPPIFLALSHLLALVAKLFA